MISKIGDTDDSNVCAALEEFDFFLPIAIWLGSMEWLGKVWLLVLVHLNFFLDPFFFFYWRLRWALITLHGNQPLEELPIHKLRQCHIIRLHLWINKLGIKVTSSWYILERVANLIGNVSYSNVSTSNSILKLNSTTSIDQKLRVYKLPDKLGS